MALLKSILQFASYKGYCINFNPDIFSIKQVPKRLRILTTLEQERLCAYLKASSSPNNLGILLCLFTGIRIGELCSLKWKDIQIEEQSIFIHCTMQRIQITGAGEKRKTKVLVAPPKSVCSIRTIPLPDCLLHDLETNIQPPETFFLTGDEIKYVEPRTMQNRFQQILNLCNIDAANFHSLRHTFATRCIELGFDVKSLSEILGHANVNITLNRYVHPSMDLKRSNMSKLNTLFAVKK